MRVQSGVSFSGLPGIMLSKGREVGLPVPTLLSVVALHMAGTTVLRLRRSSEPLCLEVILTREGVKSTGGMLIKYYLLDRGAHK